MECVINKLREAIDNPDLITPTEVRLKSFAELSVSSTNGEMIISPKNMNSPVILKVLSGEVFVDSGRTTPVTSPLTISQQISLWNRGSNIELAILNKENLKRYSIDNLKFPLEQVKYCSSMQLVGEICISGKWSDIKNISVEANTFANIKIIGEMSGEIDADCIAKISACRTFTSYFPITNLQAFQNIGTKIIVLSFNSNDDATAILGNNESLRVLNAAKPINTWNSRTLRNISFTPIGGHFYFKTSQDTDNFLINMAACEGTDYLNVSNKTIYIEDGAPRTSESDDAVASLESRGFTIR